MDTLKFSTQGSQVSLARDPSPQHSPSAPKCSCPDGAFALLPASWKTRSSHCPGSGCRSSVFRVSQSRSILTAPPVLMLSDISWVPDAPSCSHREGVCCAVKTARPTSVLVLPLPS